MGRNVNNKEIGNEFEKEFCELLKQEGYWVHFITPDKRGAQPFDVIAIKNNFPYAFDCKTSVSKWFSMRRLEDNQIMAFDKWARCGNSHSFIAIKFKDRVYCIPYIVLLKEGKVDLEDCENYRWK